MKNIKLYWLRFKSITPKALRKLQIFLSALLVPLGGAIGFIDESRPIHEVMKTALIVIPFMVMALQFATSDKEIQRMNKNDV